MTLTLDAAKAIRDGGIDALAALNDLLQEALPHLTEAQQDDLTRITGKAMGMIVMDLINPAVKTYPELEPEQKTWKTVARETASRRAAQAQA